MLVCLDPILINEMILKKKILFEKQSKSCSFGVGFLVYYCKNKINGAHFLCSMVEELFIEYLWLQIKVFHREKSWKEKKQDDNGLAIGALSLSLNLFT